MPMMKNFSRKLRPGPVKSRRFLNSPGGSGSNSAGSNGNHDGPAGNFNHGNTLGSVSCFTEIDLTDAERQHYELQYASISTAVYRNIVDLRNKLSAITRVMKRLMSKHNATVFNIIHQSCLKGEATPQTLHLLQRIRASFKLTVQHYRHYEEYIREFDIAYVFYRAVEIIDDHIWTLDGMYGAVTIDPSESVVAGILAAFLNCISMVKSLKILMDHYIQSSIYFQEHQRQKECRATIAILFHNIAYQGQKYANLKNTVDTIRRRKESRRSFHYPGSSSNRPR